MKIKAYIKKVKYCTYYDPPKDIWVIIKEVDKNKMFCPYSSYSAARKDYIDRRYETNNSIYFYCSRYDKMSAEIYDYTDWYEGF